MSRRPAHRPAGSRRASRMREAAAMAIEAAFVTRLSFAPATRRISV
ncbi:hypothetical protein BMAJHU_C0353 [Burkholderia mallei JHU]|uniref:Uncharacterized protein n=1 Tax=Burkholderia mallei (strain NCTC 10229) TaxID=412022 RepID=A2S3K9_BURM9|nr:hypothetical protein BMA10229_A0530 [Burkholderia mallei NCTC 10229]EDK60319.1 hypothetical protein BMAJHU_C0353 [Burkholderia mallei JHU]